MFAQLRLFVSRLVKRNSSAVRLWFLRLRVREVRLSRRVGFRICTIVQVEQRDALRLAHIPQLIQEVNMTLLQFDFRTALADRVDPVENNFVMVRIDTSLSERSSICGRQGISA